MSNLEVITGVAQAIIRKQHEVYSDLILDDSEYFVFLRSTIEGVHEYLKQNSYEDTLIDQLIQYARDIYVTSWLYHAHEDEDEVDVIEETKDAVMAFNIGYKKH